MLHRFSLVDSIAIPMLAPLTPHPLVNHAVFDVPPGQTLHIGSELSRDPVAMSSKVEAWVGAINTFLDSATNWAVLAGDGGVTMQASMKTAWEASKALYQVTEVDVKSTKLESE